MWQQSSIRPQASSAARSSRPSRRKHKQCETTARHRSTQALIVAEYEPRSLAIEDHEGSDVRLAWCPRHNDEDPPDKLPPFPFQVYLTHTAEKAVEDVKPFAERFACFIEWIGGILDGSGPCPDRLCFDNGCRHRDGGTASHYRFEVYSKPLTNVLSCVAHQRREIQHRRRDGIWPGMVSKWTTSNVEYGYSGRVIVVDRANWEQEGILLVQFDPARDGEPISDTDRGLGVEDYHTIAEVCRVTSPDLLRVRLRAWWADAGHSWIEAELARKNNGGFSPALYPAFDPTAHYDAEHDVVQELDITPLDGAPATQTAADQWSIYNPWLGPFDQSKLFKRGTELDRLCSQSYSDAFGLPITSVWDSKLSTLRPTFSMTVYTAFDFLPVDPRALFTCLNSGLISRETWTLDVVSNMASLDAAFEYHSRASARRTRAAVVNTRSCMEMLVEKVGRSRLPLELSDHIVGLLTSPEIPEYSARPARLFQNVFMYLDPSHLSTGPLLVYSNPAPFFAGTGLAEAAYGDCEAWFPGLLVSYTTQTPLLQMKNLRHWHLVADEIHILWSYCGPKQLPEGLDIPGASLDLQLPSELQWQELVAWIKEAQITVHCSEQITVHHMASLSHSWYEAFHIIDIKTGNTLPFCPREFFDISDYMLSWSRRPEAIGYHSGEHFETLFPHCPKALYFFSCYEQPKAWNNTKGPQKILLHGHRYALRLRDGFALQRWTFGAPEERKYNLPPIPITMSGDSQLTFRYIGDRDDGHADV